MPWIWILAGVLVWLALLTVVVALCAAAGRADRAMESAPPRGGAEPLEPGRRFVRRGAPDPVARR